MRVRTVGDDEDCTSNVSTDAEGEDDEDDEDGEDDEDDEDEGDGALVDPEPDAEPDVEPDVDAVTAPSVFGVA